MRLLRVFCLGVAVSATAACKQTKARPDTSSAPRAPEQIAPLSVSVKTTEETTLRPTRGRAPMEERQTLREAAVREAFLASGHGEVERAPGEPVLDRWPPGLRTRPPGQRRHRVARLAHVTDMHVVDDESPARVVDLDDGTSFPGAYRPQETYSCRVLDAAVRTLNRMDGDDPFDALVFGGDAIDDAQSNELDWFLQILEGQGTVACDSGTPDDPVAGPGNDPKDPFVPEGLDSHLSRRWYWVMGNHDVLAQGNFPCDAAANVRAVGARASGGTIAWTGGTATVVHETTPDRRRVHITRESLLGRLGEHAPARDVAHGSYTVDIAGSPVRLLVVDTVAASGGAAALVLRQDLDGFVVPELHRAAADGKWVLVVTHHSSDTFDDGTGFNGHPVEGAVRGADWEDVLGSSGVVVASVVGHGHRNRVRRVGREPHAFWEVETSALSDYPSEFRVIDIWDEDNGLLALRSTLVDYVTEGNGAAAAARRLSVLDFTTGESCCGPGAREDRNVRLWSTRPGSGQA
ncbi:MAG: metallophosphoesterase, partial [Myxococcota bacterium]|nr:metallophosphoesterase [Myxococcota bacterium]